MILAAGKGERMHPLTEDVPKALVNVGGKTLLDWAIERLVHAGLDKIVVAVGWKGSMVREYLESISKNGVSIVEVANYEVGPLQTLTTAIETFDDDFLLTPVDALIDSSVVSGLLTHYSTFDELSNMILAVDFNTDSGTPVSTSPNGFITSIGQKVSDSDRLGHSAMLFIGNSELASVCRKALTSGETKLSHLLDQIIHEGLSLRYYSTNSRSIDVDTLLDVLSANRLVLQKGGFSRTGLIYVPEGDIIEIGDKLTMNSRITLERGTEIRGPVLISHRCKIGENCRIGPNVTIGLGCRTSSGCDISDAIVFGQSTVAVQTRLHKTIVYNSKQYKVEP